MFLEAAILKGAWLFFKGAWLFVASMVADGQYDLILDYARVSSLEQAQNSQALEQQLQRLENAKPPSDFTFCDRQSGDDVGRPQYQACLDKAKAAAKSGLRVCIRFVRLDRWGRNDVELERSIEECDRLGITLYSLDDGVYSAKDLYEWWRSKQMSALAQYYVRQLSHNIRMGNEHRRRKKKPLCNRPPFGYLYTNNGLVPHPEQWAKAREMIEAYLNGSSMRDLARRSHFSCAAGVHQWLKNPILRGDLPYSVGGLTKKEVQSGIKKPIEIHYDCHPPLISREEWRLIDQKMSENRTRWGNNRKYPPPVLSGLVVCGKCGKKCAMRRPAHTIKYRIAVCRTLDCKNKTIQDGVIEELIQERIAARAEEIAAVALEPDEPKEIPTEILKLQDQRAELERMRDALGLSSLNEAIAEIDEKIVSFSQDADPPHANLLFELAANIANSTRWEQMSDTDRRFLYRELVDRVVVIDGKVTEIRLKF